jgi:hypothetical protein
MDLAPRRPASFLISLWQENAQGGFSWWRGTLVTASEQRLHFSSLAELNRLLCELSGWQDPQSTPPDIQRQDP